MQSNISRRSALALTALAAGSSARAQTAQTLALRTDAEAKALTRAMSSFSLREDTPIIEWLQVRPGDQILDAGCGKGDHTLLFAQRLRAPGAVTALDLNPDIVAYTRNRIQAAGLQSRARYLAENLMQTSLGDASMDLVWSSHVLHGLADIPGALRSLYRVTRPGGRIVLRENRINASMLPYDIGIGKPGLEARLALLFVNAFTEDRIQRGRYPHGWEHALREAGCKKVAVKSFLHEVSAPFSEDDRLYLTHTLRRRIGTKGLSEEDNATLRQLVDPRSRHFFLNRDDVNYIAYSTIYVGTV